VLSNCNAAFLEFVDVANVAAQGWLAPARDKLGAHVSHSMPTKCDHYPNGLTFSSPPRSLCLAKSR
jgi:hypothetical protein